MPTMCKTHWDRLRAEIDARGLSDLVAPDGKTAAMQIVDQVHKHQDGEQEVTPANFDPLMAAFMGIMSNGIELAGLEAMTVKGCLLCWIIDEAPRRNADPATFEKWIEYAANDSLTAARSLGLVDKEDPS